MSKMEFLRQKNESPKAYIFIFKVFFGKEWRNKDPGVERSPKR
jgi:hypothetical protein